MWIRHGGFMELVRNCWGRPIEAGGLLGLQTKLARIKKTLKQWNRDVFGNIHNNLKEKEEEIAAAQSDFETNPLPANRTAINKLIANYILLLKMEEDFWRQKASLRWLSDGDRNTRFYQSWVKQKRVRLRIHGILDNGREIVEEEEIKQSAVAFFQGLLAPGPLQLDEPNLDLLQPLPSPASFAGLSSIPVESEVKEAVFSISGDSTPGPDGFTASFFQACWDIVGLDVVAAVVQFFHGAYLPRTITATSIVLIPKVAAPKTWSDYRPISLCNVTNKIITKILTARLAPILPLTVSPNQSGFIRGRLLNDNVLLAQELFHELHRCSPAPNVAIKIDMSKAYDRVQWPFLIKVMRRMGFPEAWLNLVERCIGSCWFSILINGTPAGFFKSTQGLRQGDPISPALFVIAAEYLSKALDNLILGKKEMVFKSTRGSMEISHLAYADDIIIFSQAASGPLRQLRLCLEDYAGVSGQQINIAKSNFYIDEAHERWADSIQREGGFSRGSFPFLYLGVPIYRGVKRTDMFLFLREKISKRISSWAHRHLSFGGRLTLIKSTLEAIPIHIFQAIEPTKGALHQFDQQLARFFWGATNEQKKTHWIGWDQICLPLAEGGLGIRRFKEVLRAFNIKLWWRFREQSSLWAKFLMEKYCSKISPLTSRTSGRNSPTWKRLARNLGQAQPYIRWLIGEGKVYFWDDTWFDNLPLRERSLDDRGSPAELVSDFMIEGKWNVAKIQQLHSQAGLPQQVIDDILNIPIMSGNADIPRWTMSQQGDFTLSSAWEIARDRGPIVPGLEAIWKVGLTSSMSIFMWRLLSNRIPVDTKLQWRKIELASKCHCCHNRPGIESLQHLFIQGAGATSIWKEFDGWFPGSISPLRINDSIPDRLDVWAKRYEQPANTHISRIIPYLILWFIWAERNRSKHQGSKFKTYNVVWKVQMHLWNLMSNGRIGPEQWRGAKLEMAIPNQNESRNRVRRPLDVKWHPPDQPWIKLNTGGALEENNGKAGGGGLFRDHLGRLLSAFATPLTASSALEAELMAIYHGLVIAKDFENPVWVEMDDGQAGSIIRGSKWGPAEFRHTVGRILLLKRSGTFRFTTVRREGNKAAAFLAKLGMEKETLCRMNAQSGPRLLQALVRLDQFGAPGA